MSSTLPDYLRPGLNLVFIGVNPGLYSVARGRYFARSTNRFWPGFSKSRLSLAIRQALELDRLGPEHDSELPRFGIGFTDIVKRPSANAADLTPREFAECAPLLLKKLQCYRPRVACFHGLTAYRPFLRFALLDDAPPVLGPQEHMVGDTRLYVVPNPSPANAHFTLADQAMWYDRLTDFVAAPNPRAVLS